MRRENFSDLHSVLENGEGRVGGAPSIARPLGSLEHLFWLADQHRPFHFAVTVEIEGKTTLEAWRYALDRAQARHPLLSASIDDRVGVPHFVSHGGVRLPLRVVETGDPALAWQAEMSEELVRTFEFSNAPLARAVLVHAPDRAAFILVLHHAIGDGMTALYLFRDVLTALAGGKLTPLPLSPSLDDLATSLDRRHASEPDGPETGEPLGPPSSFRPRNAIRPTVRGIALSQTLTGELRDRARREGTTVHGALLAAFAISGAKVSAGWRGIPIRILSPVNIRRALRAGEDCGLFVTGAANGLKPASFRDVAEKSFWDLARHARRGVAASQNEQAILAAVSALKQVIGNRPDVVSAAAFISQVFAHEAILSNLGELPFESRIGDLTMTSVWGPAVLASFDGEQSIGAATVDGRLFLTHCSYTPIGGLLDEMRTTLVRACAT